MKHLHKLLCSLALISSIVLAGCAATDADYEAPAAEEISSPESPESYETTETTESSETAETADEELLSDDDGEDEDSQIDLVMYIKVTADGVNIRGGPGTDYKVLGTAEKDTLYAANGKSGNWYKTYYKGMEAYIYEDYCILVEFEAASEKVEAVIAEGTKYMGVEYVYGATRYHDGNGVLLSGFTTQAFDCSSLMQYIFKVAADINLQMTTRTQVVQGTTVNGELMRGDLMFFTNSSRKNNTGVERIGHVALYLGNNYILHTASDYAKIEQISSARWSYFIQAQRLI